MKSKEFLEKATKTQKVASGGIALFLGVVGVIAFVQKCSTKNVSGNWHLELKVEKSAYNALHYHTCPINKGLPIDLARFT